MKREASFYLWFLSSFTLCIKYFTLPPVKCNFSDDSCNVWRHLRRSCVKGAPSPLYLTPPPSIHTGALSNLLCRHIPQTGLDWCKFPPLAAPQSYVVPVLDVGTHTCVTSFHCDISPSVFLNDYTGGYMTLFLRIESEFHVPLDSVFIVFSLLLKFVVALPGGCGLVKRPMSRDSGSFFLTKLE